MTFFVSLCDQKVPGTFDKTPVASSKQIENMNSPSHILELLVAYKKESKLVFNPWAESCAFDKSKSEIKNRQERLLKHLSNPTPRFLLIGEAAGYQGCRYSGITFTSEKILLNEGIPRVKKLESRVTNRDLPFNEPSATIVWGALKKHGIENDVILWNTFPFHPMTTKGIHTNRTPTNQELDEGAKYLQELLGIFTSRPKLIAVGKKAQFILNKIGHTADFCVRHPAFGGANEFRLGIKKIVQD